MLPARGRRLAAHTAAPRGRLWVLGEALGLQGAGRAGSMSRPASSVMTSALLRAPSLAWMRCTWLRAVVGEMASHWASNLWLSPAAKRRATSNSRRERSSAGQRTLTRKTIRSSTRRAMATMRVPRYMCSRHRLSHKGVGRRGDFQFDHSCYSRAHSDAFSDSSHPLRSATLDGLEIGASTAISVAAALITWASSKCGNASRMNARSTSSNLSL